MDCDAFAFARVLPDVLIPWEILDLAIRIEGETLHPLVDTLRAELTLLHTDIVALHETLTDLAPKVDQLLLTSLNFQRDTAPLWDDSYTLCGDPHCEGDCRVCQEGEYDGEDDYTEKYCRRGRR